MPKKSELKKELNLFQVTVAGVGIILGAGIYALIGIGAGDAGNAVWLSFLLSAIVALLTGLSYAELSSMFKGDAAEYDYVNTATNKTFATIIGLSMIASAVVAASTVSLGFAGYLSTLIPIPFLAGALGIIVLMTVINYVGIKETSWFATISTFIELFGLLVIIVLGLFYVGDVNYLEMPQGFGGVVSSAALVFFAFIGFESIVKLRDETKNAARVIPKAVIYSVIITSIVYVLVAIAAVSIVGWETLSESQAPLATAASAVLGTNAGIVLAIIALFATSNTVLLSLVTASRQVYGMAVRKSLPKPLGYVSRMTKTPVIAVVLVTVVALLLALVGDIEFVANLTNVFIFITFAAVNLSLIILRYKCKTQRRTFKCPANVGEFSVIAFFGLVSSVVMLVFVILNMI